MVGNTSRAGETARMFHSTLITLLAGILVSCASPPPLPPEAVGEIDSSAVPEPFWDFDPGSNLTINYEDVDAVLRAMVIDVGRSSREKLPANHASTGTRLRTKVKRATANEANRFYFEEFEDNEDYKNYLRAVRKNLEAIPDQVPLERFSREEQLAYWLNLYNITVLDQLVRIYPERNLKREITGGDSIFTRKILNVAGVPLSLNDIQHTILRWNYDDNPVVIYGLYQGNIGGPNIREYAYRGKSVYKDLVDNAEDFINSNRGTAAGWADKFRVSSFYMRNRGYFPNWNTDLKAHLMLYIEGSQREQLRTATELVPDIDDWTITDTVDESQMIASSMALNPAAMLSATSSQQTDQPEQTFEGAAGTVTSSATTTSVNTNYTALPFTKIARDPNFARFKRFEKRRVLNLDDEEKTSVTSEEADPPEDSEES